MRSEQKGERKNAIHPQSRFGRLSRRWSSGDFWWHRCGRAVVLRFATLVPDTLVPVGELIYNAHLGSTKGLLSSSRFNAFSPRDESRLRLSFFFSSLFRRHSTNPFSARRLAFSFPKATLSRPRRPSGSLDCSSLRLLSALLTPFCLDGRRVSDPVTGATRVRHKSDSVSSTEPRTQSKVEFLTGNSRFTFRLCCPVYVARCSPLSPAGRRLAASTFKAAVKLRGTEGNGDLLLLEEQAARA